MKKHYETHVEDTDKLISVAGPVLDYKSWYEQYRKLMEEQAQRKYGLYTPTSEGDDDDFPSIPGMIARYSALGLTNEQMAENPVWKDLTGNGHDLQMKNFGWARMSGVGGYSTRQSVYKFTPDIYTMICVGAGATHMSFTFKVTGLKPDTNLTLMYAGTSGQKIYGKWTEDGIYSVDSEIEHVGQPVYFYNGYGSIHDTFTIEILPLYPGALVFDGVDDYGTCDNFPVLTKEKGYTVVALRQWITYNPNAISAIATNASDQSFNGAFTFENYNKGAEQTISYGATQISLQYSKSPFSWQTTSKYNGVNIANGNKDATNSLVLGRSYPQRNDFANFAIWELVYLDHDATEEELTKIKDYFVKTYPWLFPDQAWTVTGKTNEDEDRAAIANITGNGNDLVLSNFGFAEGSGYNEEGEYAGYLVTDGVDDMIRSSSFLFGNDFTVVGEWEFLQEDSNVFAGFNKNYTYFVLYNYISGVNVYVKNGKGTSIRNTKTLKAVTSEGLIYTDFNSEQKVEIADKVEADFPLYIAYNGNNYTKMAFKNLAIYPTILSKEDCIKAYNYLQTLKSK